jgi:hypothetical protein
MREDVEEAGGDPGIARSEEAEPPREGEDPLAHRDTREDVVGQVVGGVLHAAGIAGGAGASLAAESHEALETAARTADPGEAPGEDAAVEVCAQVAPDVGGQPPAGGTALAGGGEEGLEPFADDGVQERLLGLAPAVSGERRARRAGPTLPGLDWRRCFVHGARRGKRRAR